MEKNRQEKQNVLDDKLKNSLISEYKNGISVSVGLHFVENGDIFVDFGEFESKGIKHNKMLATISNREDSVNYHPNLYSKIKRLLKAYGKPVPNEKGKLEN
ncbi:hypothetical protein [Bacillus subtilis]|uniref:hypothetical protein n=1 Tax=Bacillus subtilis TaxID=1423 RepID=UPI000C78958E|nr:hypothetical protein [Bacillus subtilis]PLV32122.1 hypothetical protein BSP4_30980 [Bacillus subtilis subsp. subtilis]WDI23571.1 hypothetical protein PUW21_11155 [Bacillus subtilis]